MGMKGLVDTHALLWALFEPEKLGKAARIFLENPDSVIYTSAVNFFEIAQKTRLGKLPVSTGLVERLPRICREQRWTNLDLRPEHAVAAGLYPSAHRDPFDRLLASQSACERLPLVSCDSAFGDFPVEIIW